jgi:hypothetical protein
MTLRPLGASLLALAALGLVACGGDTPSTAGSAESEDQARQAELRFARCMRDEGIDMPDPSADGSRDFRVGGDSGISPEEFERASSTCEKYRRGSSRPPTEEEQQRFREMALAHSRCMREHGISVSDPIFHENGKVQVRVEGGSGKPNPEDPEFKAAEEACRHLMKGGKTGK